MDGKRFIISDASKNIDVEPHTLRYWEEELDVSIPRNEMGHRYYTENHLKLFKTVKILKEAGYQLRAIKMVLEDINKMDHLDSKNLSRIRELLNEKALPMEDEENTDKIGTSIAASDGNDVEGSTQNKMGQFKYIMSTLITDALKQNNEELSSSVSENVIKEMDYLLRIKEEKEEERFKKFDESLREYQKMRAETAAVKEMKTFKSAKPPKSQKSKGRLFHKKKK